MSIDDTSYGNKFNHYSLISLQMEIKRHHFESIDSTNTWAKAQSSTFNPDDLTLVTATHQTHGQGRLGRTWISPPGSNIYATYCFFLKAPRPDVVNIPQIMALAAAEVIEHVGFEPQLKWPNDLLLNNKKLGGILTETQFLDKGLFVALGIGINVNMPSEETSTIERPATSLFAESGKRFDIEMLLKALTDNLLTKLQQFLKDGFHPFLKSYQQRLIHAPQTKMSFRDSQKTWEGNFVGINDDGTLSMKLDDGSIKVFYAGEPF